MNSEIYEKTKRLIRALNLFVAHVFAYFLANVMLSIYTFSDIASRWGFLFIIALWALVLIYHGIRVYGIDPISGKRSPKLLSVLLKTMGV